MYKLRVYLTTVQVDEVLVINPLANSSLALSRVVSALIRDKWIAQIDFLIIHTLTIVLLTIFYLSQVPVHEMTFCLLHFLASYRKTQFESLPSV